MKRTARFVLCSVPPVPILPAAFIHEHPAACWQLDVRTCPQRQAFVRRRPTDILRRGVDQVHTNRLVGRVFGWYDDAGMGVVPQGQSACGDIGTSASQRLTIGRSRPWKNTGRENKRRHQTPIETISEICRSLSR